MLFNTLLEVSHCMAQAVDASADEPAPVPTKPEIDGDGAWVPFASKKTERESGWLLEQVCKVPALAKLTRREQGVVIDAFRRKVFQGGQRLYVRARVPATGHGRGISRDSVQSHVFAT